MLLSPLPGVSPSDLLTLLRNLRSQAGGLYSVDSTPHGTVRRLWTYLEWVDNTARHLSSMIDEAAIGRLVRTSGYRLLLTNAVALAAMTGGNEIERLVNTMVHNEVTARFDTLQQAITELEEAQQWQADELVVLDTNVYLEHEQKLEVLDLAGLIGADDRPVRLLVPIAVVDELDRAKRNDKNRWRAGYSLACIIKAVRERDGVLREADSGSRPEQPPRGRIAVEVVLDPPGHHRMPEPDDEIADRALSVQLRGGSTVTMITYDTGMSLRASNAGLNVIKLDLDLGSEPAPRTSSGRTSKA